MSSKTKNNESFVTDEAKTDIKKLLDLEGSGSGESDFSTQIETTEGLTLGKGTDTEASIDGNDLQKILDRLNCMKVITVQNSDTQNLLAGEITAIRVRIPESEFVYDVSNFGCMCISLTNKNVIITGIAISGISIYGDYSGAINRVPNLGKISDLEIEINVYNPTDTDIIYPGTNYSFIFIGDLNN